MRCHSGRERRAGKRPPAFLVAATSLLLLLGCATPGERLRDADEAAGRIIAGKQGEALGREEPFTVESPGDTLRRRLLEEQGLEVAGPASYGSAGLERPAHWPPGLEKGGETAAGDEAPPWSGPGPVTLSLVEALQVGARNSREYQGRKEDLFRTALRLDLEREQFRRTFKALFQGAFSSAGKEGERATGGGVSAETSILRRLRRGGELTARIALDLVRMVTGDGAGSLGLLADASITVPLLRGSGEHIVLEPLTMAEREVVYALWDFERFKSEFAVQVASSYLLVLQQRKEEENAAENYRGLITSSNRARRLAEAGTLPGFQYDQALQNELRARERWIAARAAFTRRLDGFKTLVGLPVDAAVELDQGDLDRLVELYRGTVGVGAAAAGEGPVPPADAPVELVPPGSEGAGPLEMPERAALSTALRRRPDVKVALGRVEDAQRAVVVAADALRGEVTLFGSASAGERRTLSTAGSPDAALRLDEGLYTALLTVDLPVERTAERNALRESLIDLEAAVRGAQELEDRVKAEVRERLRSLLESREGIRIQAGAEAIAARRVRSTDLFLQAGRAEIRDVLESREALVTAQNAFIAAFVSYRIAELALQRDLGVLTVDEKGLWREFAPGEDDGEES